MDNNSGCLPIIVTGFISIIILFKACGVDDVIIKRKYDRESLENALKYSDDITRYNLEVELYAESIRNLDLSDLETIMKVVDDQWKVYKYQQNDEFIYGYPRVSLMKDGYGVCLGFADDFTAKMNEINPEYDAKNIFCYLDDSLYSNNLKTVSIYREVLEETPENLQDNIPEKYGNHTISSVRIPGEDYILTVDPINLTIGLLKDGEIYLFNNNSDDSLIFKEDGNYILGGDNYYSFKDTFYEMDVSMDDLKDMYSYESQEKALKKVYLKK